MNTTLEPVHIGFLSILSLIVIISIYKACAEYYWNITCLDYYKNAGTVKLRTTGEKYIVERYSLNFVGEGILHLYSVKLPTKVLEVLPSEIIVVKEPLLLESKK